MTTKQKFQCDDPPVIRLVNGRYAYRVECPWKGREGKTLHAFKFASTAAWLEWSQKEALIAEDEPESPSESDVEEP